MEKKYWKGVEELNNSPEFTRLRDNEFFEHLPVDEVLQKKASSDSSTTRRDFLKFMGFSVAAASLAACEAPVKKAIPYVVKPEEITYGVPDYYASSYFDGNDYCSVLIKTREGRPIKIEGNEMSSVTKGATNARVQASVLGLYDSARLTKPTAGKKTAKWSDLDKEISNRLAQNAAAGKKTVILSSSLPSPSTNKVIAEFAAKYAGTEHIVYDAVSYSGLRKGNELSFGKAVIPSYRFDNADVIVSFSADFLSTWLSPLEFARQYAVNRRLRDGKKSMSRHIQFESILSLSGSNADNRYKLKPSQQSSAVAALYNKIAASSGAATVTASSTSVDKAIDSVAKELLNAKGKSLVVSGSNDPNEQVLVNAINNLLGNYASTINLNQECNLRSGNDAAVAGLVNRMNAGEIGAIMFWNSNPVYTMPNGKDFQSALSKVGLKISFADREDETAQYCDFVCPESHYLESWNDFEPYKGYYSLAQPTIRPLFDTRQPQESLMKWAGMPQADYYSYIQENWRGGMYAQQTGMTSSDAFWSDVLRNGVFEIAAPAAGAVAFTGNVQDAASKITKPSSGIEVIAYEKAGIGNGSNTANNPWLQEFPDPISKVCWDNYFAVLPSFAKAKGLTQGNIIEVKVGNVTVKGPVFLQPAMADETIAAAVGYGRTKAGKAANQVGFNAYPFASVAGESIKYFATGATLNKTVDDDHILAATQTHHTMMGREIVRETTLSSWLKDPQAGNAPIMIETPYGKQEAEKVDLWATEKDPGFDRPNHSWGLGIDLNACIGCGGCVVACNAENNVAVVGKDEIMRAREMHWIRIDRYYSSDTTKENAEGKGLGKLDMYGEMEKPAADNPEVVFQPVMCQHCNSAPCETVCPVAATTHSSDGLNMMAYNRCVGTRYCANNCPYKVRRFNWFEYERNPKFAGSPFQDNLAKMVLNPDVVVRSRGVMEKCSMCIQRIQYGKLEAKKAGRRPMDGEIKTACAQACPTNAIIFGDFNDTASEVNKLFADKRSYHLLAEIRVKPSVFYQTKVRNKSEGHQA